MNTTWMAGTKEQCKRGQKRKVRVAEEDDDDDGCGGGGGGGLEALFKPHGSMYTQNNHIHFNDDVTQQSMFQLAKELRSVAKTMKLRAVALDIEVQPIYLHITTNGGEIHAAFTVVDCMKSLGVPVYSVVDGFVASAGTLISLAADKRYVRPNAYMLIHQLSSGVWGKMNAIEEQVGNMKKLMDHITDFYLEHTPLKSKALHKLLLTDVTWNAEECVRKGIADEIYED